MANFPDINALTLGNTFGAWYAKTNEIITRLNTLEVSNIVSGDGVTVRGFTSGSIPYGGYTLDIGDTVSKNVTFNGNVTINGVLSSSYGVDVSGINVVLPANTGVTVGNIVYMDSTGKIQKALANDECTSEVVGVVIGFTGGNAQVATTGKISGSSVVANFLGTVGATLQKGVVYFLSGGVSGAGTTLEPDVTSYVSKPMLLGLTGDTGLILPYRGYIGLTAASSTTVVSGVCGGVTSLNKSTGRFYANQGDYDANIWKTTGDMLAVQSIYAGNSNITRDVQFDFIVDNNRNQSSTITDPIRTAFDSTYTKTTLDSSEYLTYEQKIPLFNTNRTYPLFATSGITADVWKLKNIKIHVQDAPVRSFSYALIRSIHRFGGTNYIMYNGFNDGAAEGPAGAALAFGMSEVNLLVASQTTVNGTSTSAITGKTILSPQIHTPYSTSIGTSRPTGDGFTAGVLLPKTMEYSTGGIAINVGAYAESNSSGKYPIIYGKELSNTTSFNTSGPVCARTYAWDFTGATFGGTSQAIISECIKSSIEGTDINLLSPSGVTMDSSILGWNANYGAVSESLTLLLFDFPTTGKPDSAYPILNSDDAKMRCVVYVEMCKFDTNTKAEGATIIINVPIIRGQFANLSMFGYNATSKQY
jgi:hypothetical protein